jgi:hypothetical protein
MVDAVTGPARRKGDDTEREATVFLSDLLWFPMRQNRSPMTNTALGTRNARILVFGRPLNCGNSELLEVGEEDLPVLLRAEAHSTVSHRKRGGVSSPANSAVRTSKPNRTTCHAV